MGRTWDFLQVKQPLHVLVLLDLGLLQLWDSPRLTRGPGEEGSLRYRGHLVPLAKKGSGMKEPVSAPSRKADAVVLREDLQTGPDLSAPRLT